MHLAVRNMHGEHDCVLAETVSGFRVQWLGIRDPGLGLSA